MNELVSLVQRRRDANATVCFFRKVLTGQKEAPRRLVTDSLRSYAPAARCILPTAFHETEQYANSRAELSHQSTRQRERQMRRFKSRQHGSTRKTPGSESRYSHAVVHRQGHLRLQRMRGS